jgi:hypothetical protein
MPDITFRLPGSAMYSYAEVRFSENEFLTTNPGETRAVLEGVLADLNAAYPRDAAPQAAPVQQAAPVAPQQPQQAAPAPAGQNCVHGPRKHSKGTSARGEWQALFCAQPKGQGQCPAVWLKTGEPGWVWS